VTIPTEPIGSLPRDPELIAANVALAEGRVGAEEHAEMVGRAVRGAVAGLEAAGSPVVTDGEQGKPDFLTYAVAGGPGLAPGGVVVPYADGHQRQLPVLSAGPLRFRTGAGEYLRAARRHTALPVKQAVAAPSALSLLYPADGIAGYDREAFLQDLVIASRAEIRDCLDAGAHVVQLDFEEARLALKFDPSGSLLDDLVNLNNRVLAQFSEDDRARIGVWSGPGADLGSTHSADVDYAELLPRLFQLTAGVFYLQLASEPGPDRVLSLIGEQLRPGVRVFVGVTDPIDPHVETPEQVRDRVLSAARFIPLDRLGTCDDAGFAPYADDTSTSRETAFAKVRARVEGTALAAKELGVGG
jgi:5-methyltetrahydropteroyltriglutamate--homocysteine methyltransferase